MDHESDDFGFDVDAKIIEVVNNDIFADRPFMRPIKAINKLDVDPNLVADQPETTFNQIVY